MPDRHDAALDALIAGVVDTARFCEEGSCSECGNEYDGCAVTKYVDEEYAVIVALADRIASLEAERDAAMRVVEAAGRHRRCYLGRSRHAELGRMGDELDAALAAYDALVTP